MESARQQTVEPTFDQLHEKVMSHINQNRLFYWNNKYDDVILVGLLIIFTLSFLGGLIVWTTNILPDSSLDIILLTAPLSLIALVLNIYFIPRLFQSGGTSSCASNNRHSTGYYINIGMPEHMIQRIINSADKSETDRIEIADESYYLQSKSQDWRDIVTYTIHTARLTLSGETIVLGSWTTRNISALGEKTAY